MYSLVRNEAIRKQIAAQAGAVLATQGLSLVPALLIANFFFHWKSFLLEFAGFLAVWFVLDLVVSIVRDALRRPGRDASTG
jgi:hypothetical protein